MSCSQKQANFRWWGSHYTLWFTWHRNFRSLFPKRFTATHRLLYKTVFQSSLSLFLYIYNYPYEREKKWKSQNKKNINEKYIVPATNMHWCCYFDLGHLLTWQASVCSSRRKPSAGRNVVVLAGTAGALDNKALCDCSKGHFLSNFCLLAFWIYFTCFTAVNWWITTILSRLDSPMFLQLLLLPTAVKCNRKRGSKAAADMQCFA